MEEVEGGNMFGWSGVKGLIRTRGPLCSGHYDFDSSCRLRGWHLELSRKQTTITMRVAIIGGGPSGLVQLKVLAELHQRFNVTPVELKLFEAYSHIGGIFYHHSYEEGELVSSKYLTSFSDFRPRPGEPDFYSTDRYLEYLNEYTSHFRLWPYIHLSTRVKSVRRGDSSEHVVTYETPDGDTFEWECDAIAVCAGIHSIPTIPDLPGVENVPVVMHSEKFRGREQFGKDKTVMVLGSGETSCDICYLAVTGDTKQVILCHRDGWLGAPKVCLVPFTVVVSLTCL